MINISLLTRLSRCSSCSGLKTPLMRTHDTKSSSPSQHHYCLDLRKLLTVSLIILVLVIFKMQLKLSSFLFYFCPTDTVPEERLFKVLLGPFGSDVALINITFPSEVLSVADCNVRGFNVQEHMSPNSSSKVFTVEVPFMDRVVLQMVRFALKWGNILWWCPFFCLSFWLLISIFPNREKWG